MSIEILKYNKIIIFVKHLVLDVVSQKDKVSKLAVESREEVHGPLIAYTAGKIDVKFIFEFFACRT